MVGVAAGGGMHSAATLLLQILKITYIDGHLRIRVL